jgi:ABC-2 type transport system ATP-binding protein
MTTLAEARAVTMQFGHLAAVDSASLSVGGGEVVGLLGANGAGKTTLIRVLLGLLRPSSGSTWLFAGAPSRARRRRVGYVPQSLGLYDDLTVRENWNFTAAAFGIGRPVLPESIRESENELVGSLSLGMQRRVAFAVAFAHTPELLVLDEPTSGVGPLNRTRLWQDIRESAEHGVGVLVTTHSMDEAEQCDRLVVMVDGRIATEGTVSEVIGNRHVVEVKTAPWEQAYEALDREGLIVQVQGDVLRVPGSVHDVDVLLRHIGLRYTAEEVPANLEEAFVSVVSGSLQR